MRAGDIGVRSLQDWAAPVDGVRRPVPARARPGRPGAGPPPRLPGGPRGRGRCCGRLPRPGRRRSSRARGSTFPNPLGLAAGFDKNAVGIDGAGRARLRPRRGRHGHRPSRSPATRGRGCSGCPPTGRSSTGWASTTTAPRWSRARLAGLAVAAARAADAGPRRQHRQDQGRARGRPGRGRGRLRAERRACSRRTPTTWSSTSPRRTPRACAACRRSSSSARCSTRCAPPPTTRAPGGGCRCWSRSPPTSPTTTCSPSPTSPSTAGSTGSSRPTPRSPATGSRADPAEVEEVGAGGLSGAPLTRPGRRGAAAAARPGRARPHADRRRRHHHRRGRARPARRRRHPAAGLHRLRLRGTRCWPRRVAPRARHELHRPSADRPAPRHRASCWPPAGSAATTT